MKEILTDLFRIGCASLPKLRSTYACTGQGSCQSQRLSLYWPVSEFIQSWVKYSIPPGAPECSVKSKALSLVRIYDCVAVSPYLSLLLLKLNSILSSPFSNIFNMCLKYGYLEFFNFLILYYYIGLPLPKVGATHMTYFFLLEKNQRDTRDYVQPTPTRYKYSDPQKGRQ